jgi:hypothetical protein
MPVPDFSPGEVLTAAAMDSIGLWLVKTQTVGTAVSSVTVTNAFSANYDNYRVIYSGGTQTANDLSMKFGPTSVAGHNTQYYSTLFYASNNPGAFALAQTTNAGDMAWVGGGSTTATWASFDVFSPNLARWSKVHTGMYQNGNAIGLQTGEHRSTGQFTDLILVAGGGAFMSGGIIRVYGYRN